MLSFLSPCLPSPFVFLFLCYSFCSSCAILICRFYFYLISIWQSICALVFFWVNFKQWLKTIYTPVDNRFLFDPLRCVKVDVWIHVDSIKKKRHDEKEAIFCLPRVSPFQVVSKFHYSVHSHLCLLEKFSLDNCQ